MLGATKRMTGLTLKEQVPVLLVGLGHFGIHWSAAIFYLLLPFITKEMALSYAEAGSLAAMFHVSAALSNLGSGVLCDVTGRRVLIQAGSLIMAGGALLLFGAAGVVAVLYLLVILMGTSNSLWHPAAISFLAQRHPGQRGYVLSMHVLGAAVADSVAPVVAGILLAWMTWRSTAVVGSLPILALAVILAVILLPQDTPDANREKKRGMSLRDYLSGLKQVILNRDVLLLSVMAGFRSMTMNGMFVFLPMYLANALGFEPVWVGIGVGALHLGGGIVTPLAGAASDRFGCWPVVLVGLASTAVLVPLLTLTQSVALVVPCAALVGFGLFSIRPVVHSWLMNLTPPAVAGSATSLLFGIQSAMSVLAPPLGGFVADTWGLASVFYLLTAMMGGAILLMIVLPRDR